MPLKHRIITATLGAGALLLGVTATASAAQASPGWSSASPTPASVPGWAGYYTNDVETEASTYFSVPTIDCSGLRAGSFAGQALGVEFLNDYNGTTAPGHGPDSVVRAYCIGAKAYYDTAFYFPNAAGTQEAPVPAGVSVRPGDLIETSVQVTASASVDTLDNLSTEKSAQLTGPGATDTGPDVGLVALSGDASGPVQIGTPAASSPPAASTGVLFLDAEIGNQPLAAAAGLGAEEWTDPADASDVWAAPSALAGNDFLVTVTL
jgi:hypothetical protein